VKYSLGKGWIAYQDNADKGHKYQRGGNKCKKNYVPLVFISCFKDHP
jgi:hypothetical protein